MLPVIGFSLLRNAVRFDYPFLESLGSMEKFSDKIFLALGESNDSTEAEIRKVQHAWRLQLISTVWDENSRKSGLILSEQTNIALQEIRKNYQKGWAFYLQADELIHEKDIPLLQKAFTEAEKNNCDAIRFRYLHFWLRPDQIAIGSRWYPQEIRAIRIDSNCESFGDAQSFRGYRKIYESDASIYHYGHVREPQAYTAKKNDFHRWWHSDREIPSVIANGENNDKKEPILRYLGSHPQVIVPRLHKLAGNFLPPKQEIVHIFGKENSFSSNFIQNIQARTIHWHEHAKEISTLDPHSTVLLQPLSIFEKIYTRFRFSSRVPLKMQSPEAREWPLEFQALLRLSEKGISCE